MTTEFIDLDKKEDIDTFLKQAIEDELIITVISVETLKKEYDTGLPMIRGGSFKTDKEVYRVWYNSHPVPSPFRTKK